MCDDRNFNEEPYTITANCLDMPKLPKTEDTVNTRDLYQCVNVPKRYESPSKTSFNRRNFLEINKDPLFE